MKNTELKGNYDYSFQKFVLGMATKTNKEFNGLFNYDSHTCQKEKLFFEDNGEVIQTKGKISKCENLKEEENQKNNNEFSSIRFN